MNPGSATRREEVSGRAYDEGTINRAFNQFLQVGDADVQLLQKYQAVLMEGGEEFMRAFYEYLHAHPSTEEILRQYRERGGQIDSLVKAQLKHLQSLLSGRIDEDSAKQLAHIGEVHYRFGIDPVWVMGAYRLYWRHLHVISVTNEKIEEKDRPILADTIVRVLFRDMGLMLEGYWQATMHAVEHDRKAVALLQEQITSLLANLPQVLWSVDIVQNRLLYLSPNAQEICNLDVQMPIPCLGWTLPEDRDKVQRAWQKALEGTAVEVESRVQQPGAQPRWFRRSFHPFKDETGRVVRIDGLLEDATETKLTLERLHALATTDTLTGLHNRALFHDRLAHAAALASRDRGKPLVLMLIDLDHFKEINDTLGHPVGDAVLRIVAERLRDALRDSDTLARLGGDEFAVMLSDAQHPQAAAERVARKILRCLRQPLLVGDHELFVAASIGIAVFPDHADDVDTLMSRADVAMYEAKQQQTGFTFYDAARNPHTPQRLQLIGDLQHAIDNEEFCLHYQPKIELRTGRIQGVEALLRWQHPRHGVLLPDLFIPLAERSGLIDALTDWVLATAMAQCAEWRAAGHEITMAVNLSRRVFQQTRLVEKVRAIAKQAGAKPEWLELEITENVLMDDIERAFETLKRLSDLGVSISIDDFGTGHSSLAYLTRLPLDALKIDKSFVMNMTNARNDAVIVRSTIDLAHNLGYSVVAEGVENEKTSDALSVLGCDVVQGFHISRPLDVNAMTTWLAARQIL